MFRSQVTLILRGVVLIATLMLCLQGVALAEQNPYSATYVMPGCRAFMKGGSLNSFKQGWCGGLITGLAQMHRRCMPPQLTQRQLLPHQRIHNGFGEPVRVPGCVALTGSDAGNVPTKPAIKFPSISRSALAASLGSSGCLSSGAGLNLSTI